jgi:hypothetical protein
MPIGCCPYTCHPTGCEADGPALTSRCAEHVAPKGVLGPLGHLGWHDLAGATEAVGVQLYTLRPQD